MPKYSTGDSSGGSDGQTCELCGSTSDSLRRAKVAGATLQVCPDCAPHDDAGHDDTSGADDEQAKARKDRAVQNTAETSSVWEGDTSRWEKEGTDYDDDQLPYLVSDYGKKLLEARQDAGLQREELAEELEVKESELLAIEQGRATQAGIGGSLIAALEERLNVTLSESGP